MTNSRSRFDNFDVAISFCEEDDWLARDLFSFLSEMGINTFYYKSNPDLTKGILNNKINEIFNYSTLNLILWSESYDKKGFDSQVSAEKIVINERHITKGDSETLMIVSLDDSIISKKFDEITFHKFYNIGIFNIRNYIIDRLRSQYSYSDDDKLQRMFHPSGDLRSRGVMTLCSFKLDNDYTSTNEWTKYCDLKVSIEHLDREIDKNDKIFLIPSGRVTNLLSHPRILLSSLKNKNIKRSLTERFYKENSSRILTGFFFYRLFDDKENPYMYCFEYDDFLNTGLTEYKYK